LTKGSGLKELFLDSKIYLNEEVVESLLDLHFENISISQNNEMLSFSKVVKIAFD